LKQLAADRIDLGKDLLAASSPTIDQVFVIAKDLGTEEKVHGFVTSCDLPEASSRTGTWARPRPSLAIPSLRK
jgi:hypothetical protein